MFIFIGATKLKKMLSKQVTEDLENEDVQEKFKGIYYFKVVFHVVVNVLYTCMLAVV